MSRPLPAGTASSSTVTACIATSCTGVMLPFAGTELYFQCEVASTSVTTRKCCSPNWLLLQCSWPSCTSQLALGQVYRQRQQAVAPRGHAVQPTGQQQTQCAVPLPMVCCSFCNIPVSRVPLMCTKSCACQHWHGCSGMCCCSSAARRPAQHCVSVELWFAC
jgi:hypothetical protein